MFSRVVYHAKALWFTASIGNLFSWHGRKAYPYPGISLTFCRDVLPLEQVFQVLIPWQTWMPQALTCLNSVNPCELSAHQGILFHMILRACPAPPLPLPPFHKAMTAKNRFLNVI